ncbi:TRAP transporter large permease [Sedimentibacter hydroxybenzoicus DSM 7310]|uniref:TRAP transporter large permease n=1 Tax=Sedimentibacter hydroxybenzoicus DSM 7310 TaxID=1123245 RepID=A0A974BKF2_SEDHY|nr:TRAP transporter large permease [Sedimentibacter hydroxybenzoicus]NYB74940.1 TRAP transporter large permease [Sedimentibacter hydroxybenzoicus DSM 7310]
MATLLLFGTFIILLLLNVPISISLGISSIITLIFAGVPLDIIPTNIFAATSKFALLAIPFFILAGNIMEKGGISEKLINLAKAWVGHKKGGLALVCVIVSCFFAAISGSGPATVAALGSIIIPTMVNNGYKKNFASALMASAGGIGIIIPPSITFVIFGAITGASIGDLLIAGILPGILVGLALAIAALWVTRREDIKSLPKAPMEEKVSATKDALWGLMMPIIILGGIYGGIFTPTEAAAVSVIYGLAISVFIYKSIKIKDIYKILVDSTAQTAVVMFITASASLFAWVMTVEGVANAASNLLISLSGGNYLVLLIILNILLLIAGCVIDTTSALYILAPVFVPVALSLGIDIIHLGVVVIVNLAIGLITPPVGVNLYVACGVGHVSMKEIAKGVVPFLVASLIALLLITYIPSISLILPGLMAK